MKIYSILTILFLTIFTLGSQAQHSVARQWNEQLLEAIRGDFARPTVHARNLFHTSMAMYDAWAAYRLEADTYFLGKEVYGFECPFVQVGLPDDLEAAQEEAISFVAYRLIRHRFANAPQVETIYFEIDNLMEELGYNVNNTSIEYHCGAAELGNYLAEQIIEYGLQDGSNEESSYENLYYETANFPLVIAQSGNPRILYMDKWQPLEFAQFIDQSGNPIGSSVPDFLGPEWGNVDPFALKEEDKKEYERDGNSYQVYHDPGPPPYIEDDTTATGIDNIYKWGHAMVASWSSHLDQNDTTEWDISPASIGNISDYPANFADLPSFYDFAEGGDKGTGRAVNPKTGLPYAPNRQSRSDYARVLAEFWADGPDSETPPGHWFTILNTVNDHPQLEKKFMGQGVALSDLEWDVKAYIILGGAMHDAAISAWGIKGWYDYVRPVSAIRGMAEWGQGSDPSLPNYHRFGLPLIPGLIERVLLGDSLQGNFGANINDCKVRAWKGPGYISDPSDDVAGVGWILAKDWWPFQRPSFVTPPFAGYISGHSTYSRAAAEVLTALTGDPFFPGGIGEFYCEKNEFLVFEDGPSQDLTLQWATYRDASDQCSLSRIWGGIHPPCDDIPGRLIGEKIGVEAFSLALSYFNKPIEPNVVEAPVVFPNPTNCGVFIDYGYEGVLTAEVYGNDGRLFLTETLDFQNNQAYLNLPAANAGVNVVVLRTESGEIVFQEKIFFQRN